MDGDLTPALTGRRRTRPTSIGCPNPWQPEPGRAPLIAAHAAVQTNRATSVRVDVSDVVHVFRPDYPGQQRGVSWFAPVVLRLHNYDASTDAQLVRQKVAALLCGFVTNPNGEPVPPAFEDGTPTG